MKFDWGSFLSGVCAGILILSFWQKRVDRLTRGNCDWPWSSSPKTSKMVRATSGRVADFCLSGPSLPGEVITNIARVRTSFANSTRVATKCGASLGRRNQHSLVCREN